MKLSGSEPTGHRPGKNLTKIFARRPIWKPNESGSQQFIQFIHWYLMRFCTVIILIFPCSSNDKSKKKLVWRQQFFQSCFAIQLELEPTEMIHCRTSSSVKRAFVRASHGAKHPQLRAGKQQYDLWIIRIQIHLRTIHFWTTFFGSNVSDSNPSCMPFRRHLGRKVEAFWLQNRQRSCNNHRRTWLWGSRLRNSWNLHLLRLDTSQSSWALRLRLPSARWISPRYLQIQHIQRVRAVLAALAVFLFWLLWYNWLTHHASAPRWMSSPSDNFCNNWPNH